MQKKNLSPRQGEQCDNERGMSVYKANAMIQKGHHNLSAREQKVVGYVISKIKPDDDDFDEIVINLNDFCSVCGLTMDSFTEIKGTFQALRDASWWVETSPGVQTTVSWFSKVRTNKTDGIVAVRLDDDMKPYLLTLAKNGQLYTKFNLIYILPMSSQYSIRLYELLKSYDNNASWWFEVDELKRLLNAETYTNYYNFKKRVLDSAVNEINKYTDLKIKYWEEKEGRCYSRIGFYIDFKKDSELSHSTLAIVQKLDG